jgi:carbon storage regulator CsrA
MSIKEDHRYKSGLRLSRRVGESLIIETTEGPIQIEVIEIFNNTVKFLFTCPKHVKVFRKELWDRILKEHP